MKRLLLVLVLACGPADTDAPDSEPVTGTERAFLVATHPLLPRPWACAQVWVGESQTWTLQNRPAVPLDCSLETGACALIHHTDNVATKVEPCP